MHGYMGKILHVNLSDGTVSEEKISDEIYRKYLTGVGIGAYIMYRDIPAGADPLGPDNVLGFTSGMLTGTASFMTGRWMVHAKSPLTGGIGDANCGGQFAPEIKKCGYDAIFIKGISEKPVYLHVDNKGAELRDAAHVWGVDAIEAEEILTKECTTRKKPRVALIGQAGEKQSLISGVVNDFGRIAARSGLGAVMGSKKLKALVLNGNKQVKYHDPEGMKKQSVEFANLMRKSTVPRIVGDTAMKAVGHVVGRNKYEGPTDGSGNFGFIRQYGTYCVTQALVIAGDAPVKNWKGGPADYPNSLSNHINMGGSGYEKKEKQKYHCAQCAFGCGAVIDLKDVDKAKEKKYVHTHKPEYETMGAYGPLLLNADPDSILYINELLNRAGMDTISAGGTVAFAIECFENGLLTKEETGGLELKWGNHEAIMTLTEQMVARNTWLGDVLADGVKVAARKIGKGSEVYAVNAGGQELGMHDPRFNPGLGVGFNASPTPGKHTNGHETYATSFLWEHVTHAPEPKRELKDELVLPNEEFAVGTVLAAQYKMIIDAVGGCIQANMGGVNSWNLFEMLEHATGWGYTPDDYMEIGDRINTLRQMFNIKHGIEPLDNFMSKRVEKPRLSGYNKGRTLEMEPMVSLHWEKHGWDKNTGHPTEDTIQRLGILESMKEVQVLG